MSEPANRRSLHLPMATKTQSQKILRGSARCQAKKKGGGRCMMAAGWGTLHPGIGACKMHGGRMKNHNLAAAKVDLQENFLGRELEIDPVNALLWCIRLTAGEVQFWTQKVNEVKTEKEYFETTMVGPVLNKYAKQRQDSIDRLARYSAMAMSAGIAERAMRLAESYGYLIADLIGKILRDLEVAIPRHSGLLPAFREAAAEIVPRRLMELESSPLGTADEGEWEPLG